MGDQPRAADEAPSEPSPTGAPGEGPGMDRPGRGEGHDPTGLDLAHWVAGATAAGARRSAATRPLGPAVRRRSGQAASSGRMGSLRTPGVSGAHPDERDPQLLGRSMDRLISERGWSRDLDVHTILGRWPALVGPMLAQHTTPEAYAEGVITVRADSTAWATQLRHLAPRVVATLNQHLDGADIARIVVLGPDVPSWKRGRLSVRDGRGPRDTYG